MAMLTGGHRLILCPGQELVRRDWCLSDLTRVLVDHLHLFQQFLRVSQEERQIEGPRRIEDALGCLQVAPLLAICPTLLPTPQIKL